MSEQTTTATPEQQELYWYLAENMTKTGADYLGAKARYDDAKAALEALSDTASDAAAAFVIAEGTFEEFKADYPAVTFKPFRPEHIDAALSGRDRPTHES